MKLPWWRRRREAELEEEIRSHLELAARDRLERGETAEEAWAAARREFGSVALVKEVTRAAWGWTWLERLAQDVRYALRVLRKNPGFAAAALLTLALGVGATTTVFTFVDALLLRPLPVAAPEQLFALGTPSKDLNLNPSYFSYAFYQHLRESAPAFSGLFATTVVSTAGVNFSEGQVNEQVRAELVSGNYFNVLGVRPALGRALTPADDAAPGAHPFIVLSYDFWQRRYGGAQDVVGRRVFLNSYPFEVVGVAARSFFGTRVGAGPDLWATAMMVEQITAGRISPHSPMNNWLELMARLAPGTDRQQAEAAANLSYRQWRETAEGAGSRTGRPEWPELRLVPAGRGLSLLRGQYERPLAALMAAVGLLLMLACANVATLLLARAAARGRELAVRLALGAGRGRLVRQLITESLVLGVLGGALGWVSAFHLGRLLLSFLPAGTQPSQFAPDLRVLVFAAGLSLLTGLVFGAAPALLATRPDLTGALKGDVAAPRAGRGRFTPSDALTVLQVALALVLVVGAALAARTLANLKSVDLGYAPDHTLLASLDLAKSGYPREQWAAFYDRFVVRVREQPGVQAAGLATHGALGSVLPVGTRFVSSAVYAAGYEPKQGEDLTCYFNIVSPGYFGALRIALLRGRDFGPRDSAESPRVAVINEATARHFFGSEDPVGRRLGRSRAGPGDIEVVGVVRDTKYLDLREDARRIVYLPLAQSPPSLMTLFIRTGRDPAEMFALLQREVRALGPTVALFGKQTMEARVQEALRQERLLAAVASWLAGLGLLLTAVGVYGVISYAVGRRTREIGLRLALGAQRRDIFSLIIGRGLRLALVGIALGLPAAAALTRALASLLYGVGATDPFTFAAVSLLLVVVALLACYVPARRATKLDPLEALRHE